MTTGDRWKTKTKINNKFQICEVVQDTEDSAKINTSTTTRKSWDIKTGQAGGVR